MDGTLLILMLLLLPLSQYFVKSVESFHQRDLEGKGESSGSVLPQIPGSIRDVLAQNGSSAVLPCKFNGTGIVTWVKKRDQAEGRLLTVGRSTHSIDSRFVVVTTNSEWNLQIRSVRHEDAGVYECQIQTEPVQQRLIRLNITDAYSVIPGGPDLHVKQSSSLRLECQLIAATERPVYIFWYRQDRMINYDDDPEARIIATKNGSILLLKKVQPYHGGNYTCLPSNAKPAQIMIRVIEEEEKPAAMHSDGGGRLCASSTMSENIMLALFTFITFLAVNNARHG
ncbi:limbic system-associated membrane protein-like [Prorops nasuta]|uniref:limbic system-associated membrane protein-like n=1 Tax=Prorops nasuta TaxID=863751 RepID=UPI0034CD2EB9